MVSCFLFDFSRNVIDNRQDVLPFCRRSVESSAFVSRLHVGTHVNHEMTWPVELVPANGALVRPDAGVGPHVFHQTRGQHKLLVAQRTLLRPFTGVRPHVHHAVPRPLERLLAHRAGVRLHSRVCCNVRHQHVGAGKPSPALVAAVRTFPGVRPYVRRKVAQ